MDLGRAHQVRAAHWAHKAQKGALEVRGAKTFSSHKIRS